MGVTMAIPLTWMLMLMSIANLSRITTHSKITPARTISINNQLLKNYCIQHSVLWIRKWWRVGCGRKCVESRVLTPNIRTRVFLQRSCRWNSHNHSSWFHIITELLFIVHRSLLFECGTLDLEIGNGPVEKLDSREKTSSTYKN